MLSSLPDDPFNVLVQDARRAEDTLAQLARMVSPSDPSAPFLQATITSPPYGALINYQSPSQIGWGQTRDAYLRDCEQLFSTLLKWTKTTGVLWLIVDSYIEEGRGDHPSRMEPLPFTLAHLAESVGWTLREVIIWNKERGRPWAHYGNLKNSFEYVLLLVKGRNFTFRTDSLRSPHELSRWWVQYPERYHALGKSLDNVWNIPIPVQGSWTRKEYRHACPLPPELIRRLIELTTLPNDIIIDPFAGIGTVVAVGNAMGRCAVGIEINPDFAAQYKSLLLEVQKQIGSPDSPATYAPHPELIGDLRALKYPKTLFAEYRKKFSTAPLPRAAIVCCEGSTLDLEANRVAGVEWSFVSDQPRAGRLEMETCLKGLERFPPLSKFGVRGETRVVSHEDARAYLDAMPRRVAYLDGRTWYFALADLSSEEALSLPASLKRGHYPPILSSTQVRVRLDHIGDPAVDYLRP